MCSGSEAGSYLKAHRLCVSLNSRLESNKEEDEEFRLEDAAHSRRERLLDVAWWREVRPFTFVYFHQCAQRVGDVGCIYWVQRVVIY